MSIRRKRRRVEYEQLLSHGARKRHCHETVKGEVTGFVVQLEARIEGRWHPVVRYDSRHGFAHKDVCNRKGESRKTGMAGSFAEALTLADGDIDLNWRGYVSRFREGDWP